MIKCGEGRVELLEFRDWHLTLDEGTCGLESGGDEHGDCCVEEGDSTANFAGEWVEIVRRCTHSLPEWVRFLQVFRPGTG